MPKRGRTCSAWPDPERRMPVRGHAQIFNPNYLLPVVYHLVKLPKIELHYLNRKWILIMRLLQ